MRSVRQENGLRLVKDLDKWCYEANGLWHALEGIKRRVAKECGVTEAMMREAGVFVEGEDRD